MESVKERARTGGAVSKKEFVGIVQQARAGGEHGGHSGGRLERLEAMTPWPASLPGRPAWQRWLHSPCACPHSSGRPLDSSPSPSSNRSQAVKGKPMSRDEVELLYRVFDQNKDGLLELSGACWAVTHASRQLRPAAPDGLPERPRSRARPPRASFNRPLAFPPSAPPLAEMIRVEEHIDDTFSSTHLA